LYALSAITRRWYLFIKAGFKPGLDSGQKWHQVILMGGN
jgi:hypothetical protein